MPERFPVDIVWRREFRNFQRKRSNERPFAAAHLSEEAIGTYDEYLYLKSL